METTIYKWLFGVPGNLSKRNPPNWDTSPLYDYHTAFMPNLYVILSCPMRCFASGVSDPEQKGMNLIFPTKYWFILFQR